MNDIDINDAVPSDAQGLMEVRYKTWKSTYPVIYPLVTEEDIDRKFDGFEDMVKHIREGIAKNSPDKKFIMAKKGSKTVGFAIASKVAGEPREIKALYVLKEYQDRGIGRILLKTALAWLEAEEYTVMLEVVSTNEPAINFYKSYGFKKSRDLPMPSREEAPDYLPMPHIEMIRKPASIK